MVDDSSLLHAGVYDPAKARAYYLRTRKLKGRRKGSGQDVSSGGGGHVPPAPQGAAATPKTLEEHKAALEARLEHLKNVLAALVAQAKARSGVDPKTSPTAKKASSAKTGGGTLTPQQKQEAAKRSKDYYEKHKNDAPQTVQQQIDAIQKKIADIRQRIHAALEADRNQHATPTSKTTGTGR